jgi:hypothetical protein
MGWTATAAGISVVVPKGTPIGTYQLTVQGTNQGRTVSTNVSVNVVVDMPTAKPPVTSLLPGEKLGPTTLRVRVSWPAATDPSSAIVGYEVSQSTNGGAWTSPIATAGGVLAANYTLALDTVYQFRVRAVDSAGNWSPWAQAVGTSRIHPVDDQSSSIVRSKSWRTVSNSGAYRLTLSGSAAAGAKISLRFTGHGVAIVAPRTSHLGKFKIYIDGVYKVTVNQRRVSYIGRQVVWAWYSSAGGTHTITMKAVGTGTYHLVRLDAFVVSR